jgi:hypothetical protein
LRFTLQARSPRRRHLESHTMFYALAALFVILLPLAGAAAMLASVQRSLHGLSIPLTSYF